MKKSKAAELLGAAAAAVPGVPAVANAALVKPEHGGGLSRLAKKFTSKDFLIKHALPTVAGGALGYHYGKKKKHAVLGTLSGLAVGSNAYALVKGDRKEAIANIAVVGAAVGGSLVYKKHPVIGYAGAGVAAALIAPKIKDKF